MNENIEMMNFIYQNAQMGQDTLTQLLKIVENKDFISLLQSQKDEYKTIFDECDQMINEMNSEPKGIGKMAEISTYLMINFQTLTDKTPTHIAGMVMQGSVMGIIDIIRNLKKYKNAKPEILEMGNSLLKIEERNLDECKKYL
ncbi:MAG: hypothetical protein RSE93_05375 [Oscillospiraceae bacterium]